MNRAVQQPPRIRKPSRSPGVETPRPSVPSPSPAKLAETPPLVPATLGTTTTITGEGSRFETWAE